MYRTTPPNARRDSNNSLICLPNLQKFARTVLYPQTLTCRQKATASYGELVRSGRRKSHVRLGNIVQSAKQNYPVESQKDMINREMYETSRNKRKLIRPSKIGEPVDPNVPGSCAVPGAPGDDVNGNYPIVSTAVSLPAKKSSKNDERKKAAKVKTSQKAKQAKHSKSTTTRQHPIAILPQTSKIKPAPVAVKPIVMKRSLKYANNYSDVYIPDTSYRPTPTPRKATPKRQKLDNLSSEMKTHMANMREYLKRNPIDKNNDLNALDPSLIIPGSSISTSQCVEIVDTPSTPKTKPLLNDDNFVPGFTYTAVGATFQPRDDGKVSEKTDCDPPVKKKAKLGRERTANDCDYTCNARIVGAVPVTGSISKENSHTVITSQGVECIDFPVRAVKRKGRPTSAELWS